MKILVHDYSGHAFQIQLSRELARSGHTVIHAYSAAMDSPRGALTPKPDDPPGFRILAVGTPGSLNKYDFLHRAWAERCYGGTLADAILAAKPDAVIICNTPNDILDILRARLPPRLRVIWWVQDIYSVAIKSVLNRRLPLTGTLVGGVYRLKEKHFARRADHIVAITSDFIPFLRALGAPAKKISVIENWAPVDEVTPLPRENAWKHEQGLAGKRVVLYSGTMGLKHNPALLLNTAAHYQSQNRDDVVIVVATQGPGAEFLKRGVKERSIGNLTILPWQPYERLPEVLSCADILTAIIEPDAGLFSVPSKILSCFCAGRPLVASIPAGNLAAQTIERAKSGFVVEPGDEDGFIARIDQLLASPGLAEELGRNGRAYAEETFDISRIAERFLALA